jgi:hypothetical protein
VSGRGASEKCVVENSFSKSLAIFLTSNFAPAVCPFVIYPGYPFDDYHGISRVTQRAAALCYAPVNRRRAALDSIP